MTDSTELETRVEARLRAHAARSDRPFDASLVAAAAVASARPRRSPIAWRWPAPTSAPVVLLLIVLLIALATAAILSGQPIRLLGDLVPPRVAPSPAPPSVVAPSLVVPPTPVPTEAPITTVAPQPTTVADPHALLVITGRRNAFSARNACTNVERYAIDSPGSRDRLIDCAGRVRIMADGSEAAVQGARGLSFVDLRTGTRTGRLDTGQNTFAIAYSPSGRYLQWETCPDYDHGPCAVYYGAHDGSDGHVLYRPANPGYVGFIEWAPDESLVSIPIVDDVLVGTADGSDLHPRTANDWQGTAAGSGDVSVGWRPDGSAYLYLSSSEVVGGCSNFCVAEQVDVWQQPVDGGRPSKVTDLVPGDLVTEAALSPDGTSLAFLKQHVRPGPDVYRFYRERASAPTELWIRDATGTQRRIDVADLRPISDGRIEPFLLHWAPDGKHLAVEVSNGRSGSNASSDVLLVPLDGSRGAVLEDAREPVWSPDGTLIAFTHQVGPDDQDGNRPEGTSFDVAASDGSGRHQVMRPGPGRDVGYVVWARN